MDSDKFLLMYAALLFGVITGGIIRCSPTFDYSAEVLFDTKSTGASGKQWGILRYGTEGYDWEVDLRKSDAQNEMSQICSPMKYQIIDAKRINESKGFKISDYAFDIDEPSIIMHFECIDNK